MGAALQALENCLVSKLSFSTEGPYVETDRGLLDIQSNSTGVFASRLKSLFLGQNWVTYDGEKK